ncbi:MAG: PDDEXK nuclease domain-containing protein [Niabella sp.]
MNIADPQYKKWLAELKRKIRSTQIKAAIAVNTALIEFYWELGKMISQKQQKWGSRFLEAVSKDLKEAFPEMEGFSVTNLKYCRLFYLYLNRRPHIGDKNKKSPQPGDELRSIQTIQQLMVRMPWGHIKILVSKIKDLNEALFYIQQTLDNNWSRDMLALQIKSNVYKRSGNAITNFSKTLPEPQSDLAQQTLKDPYIFDFMTLASSAKEKDIENQLIEHITRFLLELGKGFAFVGKQQHIEVAGNDYYLDLLFYHTRLKCYVVIELKNTKFIPEYAGKLNFYLSAVDTFIKQDDDNATMGILLCREKNNIEAEFALRDLNKPVGVSEFMITEMLPENLRSSLPSIQEIENELSNL